MKKLLSLILAILILATTLIGCNVQPDEPEGPNNIQTNPPINDDEYDDVIVGGDPGETNPPEENPPVENPPVENPPAVVPPLDDAPESSQVASGFVAKQKKYDYDENNIIILNVTNQNEKNYSVTINGFYLDADGKVIKSETQSVEGYASGYEKYFLFNPDTAFDSFIFTLTATEFSGQCYEHNFSTKNLYLTEHIGVAEPEDADKGFEPYKQYPAIVLFGSWGYAGPVYPAKFDVSYIIIGNDGKIYKILNNPPAPRTYKNPRPDAVNSTIWYFNLSLSSDTVWPEALRDGWQVIATFTTVAVED